MTFDQAFAYGGVMDDIITITDPVEALRYVAWRAFRKVAHEIDQQRDAYVMRDSYLTSDGYRTSPYLQKVMSRKFLLDMELETPETIEPLLPPPPPSYRQMSDLAKHRNAFLRTFIRDDQERLSALIAHYDEEGTNFASDRDVLCVDFLSKRPAPSKTPKPPKMNAQTHGRILTYAWCDMNDREPPSDVSMLKADLVLHWIHTEYSPTIAQELKTLNLNNA
ncbi:MAG TPA: hypothetical protein VIN59_05870 [Alphaproteobacteria bacterium]